MATTTNYGWTTPDDTALVKDGAAAIRTLGSSVDTTTKNLNPSTTLGDIEYRSSTANTNTRLGIGSTGNVLTVAAGVPSWAAPAVSPSGMTLIDEVAFSATATVNVNDVFSATYVNYLVLVNGTAGACSMTMKLRVSGSDASSNYDTQEVGAGSTTIVVRENLFGTDEWYACEIGGTTDPTIAHIRVSRPFLTTPTAMASNWGGRGQVGMLGCYNTNSTSYTGFTALFDSNATGTIYVYGFAKE
jgi:hypothetical protein